MPLVVQVLAAAEAEAESHSPLTPYLVGAGVLLLLALLLFGLLSFGAGREHS